ncbi:probable glutathione S-transferase parA [Ziziphus jujuba]|uniref:glutathione transferase n=1 Tax=Ziziphus jujuba TaxID=326968 RepID=A0ABM3ZUX6_ZIZJJ|nr:probable glutathione S-transferase parA [Ziziphus jujuba]
MRVRIALAEKWIQYEYKEENLLEISPLLLQMNPVHKMVPVLIHNGKPICESLNILLYVDEVWPHRKSRPLLPSDPYQRSQARFWADFIDKKIYDSGKRVLMSKGKQQEEAKKEMIESLKLLEGVLGDKLYYGGEKLGLLDVAFIPFYCWFYSYETCGGFSVEAECPKLVGWVRRCKDVESVSKSLVDPLLVFDYVLQLRKRAGLE